MLGLEQGMVKLIPYTTEWKQLFEEEKARLRKLREEEEASLGDRRDQDRKRQNSIAPMLSMCGISAFMITGDYC